MQTVAESVRTTNRALCVDEGWWSYGVSAELAALPYAENLDQRGASRRREIAAAALECWPRTRRSP
jgi:pyruvate/2-oxoglutarate/acetoin dehydrogenase E1 component